MWRMLIELKNYFDVWVALLLRWRSNYSDYGNHISMLCSSIDRKHEGVSCFLSMVADPMLTVADFLMFEKPCMIPFSVSSAGSPSGYLLSSCSLYLSHTLTRVPECLYLVHQLSWFTLWVPPQLLFPISQPNSG